MTEPKISLTLTLPGRVLVSQQEAENKPKMMNDEQLVLRSWKGKRDVISFKTRKTLPIKQVLKMTEEAYQYMLNEPVSSKYNRFITRSKGKSIRIWDNISEDIRIKLHCKRIADDLSATDFTYNIMND